MRHKASVKLPLPTLESTNARDPDVFAILREIGARFGVGIKLLAENDSKNIVAYVRSLDEIKVKQAIAAIQETMGSRTDEPGIRRAELLVDASGAAKIDFQARLERTPAGSRPTAPPFKAPLIEFDDDEGQALAKEYRDAIRTKVFEVAHSLQPSPKEVKMRVHFGSLRLQEWKKDKDTYSYDELQSMIDRIGYRGTFRLDEP